MKIFLMFILISLSQAALAKEDNFLLCTYKNGMKKIKMNDTGKMQRHEQNLPDGVKQVIVIDDPWTLNNFDNYTILSKGEHSITYSLDCKKNYSKDNK